MRPRSGTRVDMLFVLPHLGAGGAQRVASVVAGHLAEEGFSIAFLTLIPRKDAHGLPRGVLRMGPPAILRFGLPFLQLARSTVLRILPASARETLASRRDRRTDRSSGSSGSGALLWTDRLRQRRILSTVRRLKPGVVMSLLTKTNVLTLLALRDEPTRVIVSERNRLARPEQPAVSRLRAELYPAHPIVTANSTMVVEDLRRELGVRHARLLPNVIRAPGHGSEGVPRGRVVSVVARLVPQKRIDLALIAFSRLHAIDATWSIQIIGDGPDATRLRRLAAGTLAPDAYRFLGHVRDPQGLLLRSRILVLPSAYEGSSNALLEAMASGAVPLVSEESDPADELVVEGVTGRRFGARHGPITAQLIRLATQDDLAALSARARAAASRFTWEHQRENWLRLLSGSAAESHPSN